MYDDDDDKEDDEGDEGRSFLTQKAQEEGVVRTKSGLCYKELSKGVGKLKPKPTDWVSVHYRGSLTNGTEFDSSYSRGQPIVKKNKNN